MRLLNRLLRLLHKRRSRHLDSCGECLLQQRRERQYLERLRGAEVPAASDDLTARLLERTEELARAREIERPGEPKSTGDPKRTGQPATAPPAGARGFRPVLLLSMYLVSGAAAAAALLGGSAYLLGAEQAPAAGGALASALLQRDLSDSGADTVEAGPGAPAGWSLTGEPDFTPAGTLTREQLSALRAEGWTCPELRDAGYHLVWARSRMNASGDFLELRLTDGRHFASVLEQHGAPGDSFPSPASVRTPPLNVLTGHPATADGFTSVPVPAANAAPPAALWVHTAAPYAAIYQTDGTTFTYVSDQPPDQADDGVAALVRARTMAPGTADGAGLTFTGRMERGLGRIVELLAP